MEGEGERGVRREGSEDAPPPPISVLRAKRLKRGLPLF